MNKRFLVFQLAGAIAALGMEVNAQGYETDNLPVPVVKPATSVSSTGYTANWEPVEGLDIDGYIVRTYITHKAGKDGTVFSFFQTGFDEHEYQYATIDNPEAFPGEVHIPPFKRYRLKVYNPVYAKSVIGIENDFAKGTINTIFYDFSGGEGKVFVKLKAMGVNDDKMAVSLYEDGALTPKFTKELTVTPEWQEYTVELEGGGTGERLDYVSIWKDFSQKEGRIFFDDLDVYQVLNEGEEGVASYLYEAVVNENSSSQKTSCRINVDETETLEPGYVLAYTVASYQGQYVSRPSELCYIVGGGEEPNGIGTASADKASVYSAGGVLYVTKVAATDAVAVYDVTGAKVGGDTTGSLSSELVLPGSGLYIVKVGTETFKIFR